MTTSPNTAPYRSFEHVRQAHNSTLNIHMAEYQHKVTGAQHIHLSSDSDEQVFLVAFRTVPMDSTGVAHILEHTVLCGSQHYPVRDPFFMMIKRSLNTFMNAFTASDWTAYPFASQNQKDFDNLLSVYLDAVFFPILDPLDFAQEGHRVEFSDPDNPNSELAFKGVVYNEMKGAMSAVNSQLYDHLNHHLFPTNTYHYNSGGDPDCITELSYDNLKHFYDTHYHPSNAIFITFGNQPAQALQEKFEQLALQHFQKSDFFIAVNEEQRYEHPIKVAEIFPASEADKLSNNTHHVLAWLLPKSTDPLLKLEANFVSNALLDNSASPLRKILETTKLGTSPSSLCGLEESTFEMSFMCGIEGSEADRAEAFETEVLKTLQQVAKNGIEKSELESVLHQLEFSQREIGGDHYPYGLQMVLAALPGAIHRSDAFALLDIDPALHHIRQNIDDPDYIKRLVKTFFLDNPHRVLLTMKPDANLGQQQLDKEKQKLVKIKTELDEQRTQWIIERTHELKARQETENNADLLPKVTVEDVPPEIHYPSPIFTSLDSDNTQLDVTYYNEGTNGICYQEMLVDCSDLSREDTLLLPQLSYCLLEVGHGELDYLATQQKQSTICGGIDSFSLFRAIKGEQTRFKGYFVLSGKCLNDKQQDLQALFSDTWYQARFDEQQRIKEILQQEAAHQEQTITGNGHQLALSAASAGLHPLAELKHEWYGLSGIKNLTQLVKQLENPESLNSLCERLGKLQQTLTQQTPSHFWIGDHVDKEQLQHHIQTYWRDQRTTSSEPSTTQNFTISHDKEAWFCHSQVNFCAKAFPSAQDDHPDAASLQVLAAYLRNGYLHTAIREQGGAYGGGATQDSQLGIFRFYSYRDPRLADTLTDFDQSIQWLLDKPQRKDQLEEAILNVISDIDKPGSPAGEAKGSFYSQLFGRNSEHRQHFRERILAVDLNSLRSVAERYLLNAPHNIAVVTSEKEQRVVEDLGLTIKRI
jgi:Zn-dependent M16 (insulinase) family peptidase